MVEQAMQCNPILQIVRYLSEEHFTKEELQKYRYRKCPVTGVPFQRADVLLIITVITAAVPLTCRKSRCVWQKSDCQESERVGLGAPDTLTLSFVHCCEDRFLTVYVAMYRWFLIGQYVFFEWSRPRHKFLEHFRRAPGHTILRPVFSKTFMTWKRCG